MGFSLSVSLSTRREMRFVCDSPPGCPFTKDKSSGMLQEARAIEQLVYSRIMNELNNSLKLTLTFGPKYQVPIVPQYYLFSFISLYIFLYSIQHLRVPSLLGENKYARGFPNRYGLIINIMLNYFQVHNSTTTGLRKDLLTLGAKPWRTVAPITASLVTITEARRK